MSEYILERNYDTKNGTFSTVKREEIVRCRDCKHSDTLESAPDIVVRCCYRNKIGIPRVVGDDGFCAWGERREQ